MPAVVVTGARQTGKSTLAQELTQGNRRFFTLDDLDVLDAARRDPEAILGGSQPVTIDEAQREPDLLHAVKRSIDRQRRPGRFLLTGSANLLLMRQVSESLAGRASYLTLWPMTRREQRGLGRGGLWEELLEARDEDWLDLVAAHPAQPEDWRFAGAPGRIPLSGPSPGVATGQGRLVRRLRAHLPGTGLAGAVFHFCVARLPPTHARRLLAHGPTGQPGGAWPRRGIAPADGAPLPKPPGNLLPAGPASRLLGKPHQASDQVPQGLLGRYRGSRCT